MSDRPQPAGTRGFAGLVGLEVLESAPEAITARVAVRDELRQPMGLVHGGVYATIAEDVCSVATARAVADSGGRALGMSNQVSFLRPISSGHVIARAHARHRGRTTWVWDVEFSDDDGRLCALGRVTIAVRSR